MKRKSIYKSGSVEEVRLAELLPMLMTGCIVALDVAKTKFVVALATMAGEVVNLLRFEHPRETRKFLALVEALRKGVGPGEVRAAMEPTGTYGDAIRHQLTTAGVAVRMVSPKKTYDAREVFDSVPSSHDPKSATLVAKLCSMGLSKAWEPATATRTRLRALVDLRRHEGAIQEQCFGRLEAQMARHWPEFGAWLNVRESKTALHVVVQLTSPARVANDPEETRRVMRTAARGRVRDELVEAVIASAKETTGVPMLEEQRRLVAAIAKQALEARERSEALEKELAGFAEEDAAYGRLGEWMGYYTAAVLVTMCDVEHYRSAAELEKGCGLNLREKSSGEKKGQIGITKRGPSLVRQVMFMFALRMIQKSKVVNVWYTRRRGHTETSKMRAVVAVMRKLVGAAFHVARGAKFDESKLFDTRSMKLSEAPDSPAKTVAQPRNTVRQRRATKSVTTRAGASASAAS